MGILSIFEKRVIADCGHETKVKDRVTAFGESVIAELPIKDEKTPYCHRCIEKMAIRCAWCGHAIFIGDPITLYTPPKDFKIPEYAVIYKENPLQLIGCLRWNCAQSGADRAGFWLPPGRVQRVQTVYEMCIRNGIVVIDDLSKP